MSLKYDITFENPNSTPSEVELFSGTNPESKVSSKFRVVDNFISVYSAGTEIILNVAGQTYERILDADTTPLELVDVLNTLGAGSWTLFASNAIDGNVFDVISDLGYETATLEINESFPSTFNIGTGFNSAVQNIFIQSDNNIIILGGFTTYNGTGANRIIRLNTDGTVDVAFSYGTGFDTFAVAIDVQSDGKILVGGNFTDYNGTAANRIIRLNTDGTVDVAFSYGTGFNIFVLVVKIQSDGKILVGGDFTSYNGTAANRIIRLNSDGTVDSTFSYGTGFVGAIRDISIQSDNKLIIGGSFVFYNGTFINRIIRLNSDGTIDGTFSVGTGFDNTVFGIYIQSDGKVLAVGDFTDYNGTGANGIIRLNSDGTVDGTFSYGTGFVGSVRDIMVQSDGKILVGGDFTSYNGTAANRIIRLNSDGTVDGTFSYGTGFNNTINIIDLFSNNKILLGGSFVTYDGNTRNFIVRIASDGTDETVTT